MKREGWESELSALVARYRDEPPALGCLMAADWVSRVTDYTPPKYMMSAKTVRSALKALKQYGGDNLLATAYKMADMVGATEVAVKRAQRGDVMAFACDAPFDAALGVCIGKDAVVTLPDGTTGLVPTQTAIIAWRL